ncbi:glutathione S-transferase Mu 1-like [Anneissia japonica]|uniref:glutathione S-transferase Mu 1-like n=1 Tax=Anneissia japonica TaxID=1529436 RepID=UPI001425B791|nr:glutathione S-transferase Mu 1-like [Anneissia japonica]
MGFSCAQIIVVLVAAAFTVYYSGQAPEIMKKVSELVTGKKGCLPVGDIDFVTIHYFNGRGRGEVIRMMLEEAQIPYNETNFTKDTWPEAKKKGVESGMYTFGQVPAITTSGGLSLVQSQTIAQYIGRATGMQCDCESLHYCDILARGAEDFRSKLSKILYDSSFSVDMRNDYILNTAPMWLGYFEKIAPSLHQQESSPYFVDGRLTWVDFIIFDLLDSNVEFATYDMGEPLISVLDSYTKLNTFYQKFKAMPRVAAYLKSPRRRPYKIPNVPTPRAKLVQPK